MRMAADEETPAASVLVGDRVRAVVAIDGAAITEVGRIADETVATVSHREEPEVERLVMVDVSPTPLVPRPSGRHAHVDRVWPFVTEPTSLDWHRRFLDTGRNRRCVFRRDLLRLGLRPGGGQQEQTGCQY